jgi:peroxiredoxin
MNYRFGRYLRGGGLTESDFKRVNETIAQQEPDSPIYFHTKRFVWSHRVADLLQKPETIALPGAERQALYEKESLEFYNQFRHVELNPVEEIVFLQDYASAIYQWGNRRPSPSEKELLLTRAKKLADEHPEKTVVLNQIFEQVTRFDYAGKVNVGMQAPSFTVESINGKNLQLEDYRGKYVFIDFWGSWCPPCLREIPNIKKLNKSIPSDSLQIIGLARDDPKALKAFLEKEKLMYPNAIADQKLLSDYAISSFPTTFLLAPDGQIIAKNLRGENLTALVRSKMKSHAAAL